MKIIILMGGETEYETSVKDYPIYMTEVNEKMILEEQIDYCQKMNPSDIIFCTKKTDIISYQINDILDQCLPNNICITINNKTLGSICTALLAAEYIDNNEEILLMSIDDFIEEDSSQILSYFRENNFDAGVVAFKSVHPRYSFARKDDQGIVIELAEKQPISKHALASFYYFKTGQSFVEAAKEVIRKDNKVQGAFYISQAINELILTNRKVGIYHIDNHQFHPMKTKVQLAQYILELKERNGSK